MVSLLIAVVTILSWIDYEEYMNTVPIGDSEFYGEFTKYETVNYIFPISILVCEIYLLIIRIVNKFI